VLIWRILRNHKEIWNSTKISVTSGMYVARGDSVQRPLTSRPAKSIGRLVSFSVGSDQNFLYTCLHEKGNAMAVKKVSEGQTHWPASHHLGSYRHGQVSGAPRGHINTPLPVKVDTHTIFLRFHLQSSHS
jgi:hypothetical protein